MQMSLVLALGESDCELVGEGLLAQPINAVSSLAYVAFGVMMLLSLRREPLADRAQRIVFGVLLVGTGIGSVLYHGPQGSFGRFLHDATLVSAILFLGTMTLLGVFGVSVRTRWISLGAIASVALVLIGIFDQSTNVLLGVAILAVLAGELVAERAHLVHRRWWFIGVVALCAASASFLLGRDTSPICDPDSMLQVHAVWHLLSATALWAYFHATTPARIHGMSEANPP